jgi:hypothetical protein
MLILACFQHWYTSAIFFAPVPIIGFFIWLSGRRHAADRSDHAQRA